ncbi:MAG: Holliday junction branch migration protein RuvA [Clostridia bacterium]|nr:Holliday junction branch migration protein RuvA [Clostridia bacterium]
MYSYIRGIVADRGHNELVVEAGGVGYLLTCSMNTMQDAAPVGDEMKVYTYLSVREDAMELFGFATREERTMFLRLTGISGIGPRTALGILGSMPLRDLTLAIVTGDTVALSRAPGIGKKTAQRIALELKEKITADDFESLPESAKPVMNLQHMQEDAMAEALLALQSLGYSNGEATKALSAVRDQSDKADELVRLALRSMM